MRSFASQREQLGVPDAPSSQAPLQPFRSLSFGLVASHLSGHGFPVHWTPPWIDYRPATCRRPDQVFCIFRCSDASGAPATIPIAELLACCESAALRNAFAVGKVSPVTCPRTTDFHSAQAIAEDLGTFAPWVFAFFGSKFRRFDPSRAGVWGPSRGDRKISAKAMSRPRVTANLGSKFRSNLRSPGRVKLDPRQGPKLRGIGPSAAVCV